MVVTAQLTGSFRDATPPPHSHFLVAPHRQLQGHSHFLIALHYPRRAPRRPGRGWAHFGDAGRLFEELKNLGELLGIDRNEVFDEHSCPGCGTRDVDRLLIDDSEVRCTVCGTEYTLD